MTVLKLVLWPVEVIGELIEGCYDIFWYCLVSIVATLTRAGGLIFRMTER